ncbi:hypothetical protein [Kaarinaea lacus]
MLHQEFVVPTDNLLDNLGPGCFVQVDQGNGAFWVEINDTDGYIFGGRVHPQLSGPDCPFHKECDVNFNREEISLLGCDRYCFC